MSESRLAVVAALVGNALIAAMKLVAGVVSQSASMLAEGAHSVSDVGNQVLLLIGMKRAARPPTPEHPFGTGKAAYFWPFLVAILLFGVAGAYSAIEGLSKIRHPHDIENPFWSFVVLGIAFAIELGSLAVAIREARHAARKLGATTVRQFLEENRDAAILTVIVEDSLALLGLPMAALFLGLTVWTGNPIWDGIGSFLIGLMLMSFAAFLGSEVQALLLGRGLSRRDREKLIALIAAEPCVARVESLQSMYLGPGTVLLGCELAVREGNVPVSTTLGDLEARMRAAVPALKYVYLEPHAV